MGVRAGLRGVQAAARRSPAVLLPLPADAWERTAIVTGMVGETYDRSARYYADWMAGHERAHLKSLPGIVAAAKERA